MRFPFYRISDEIEKVTEGEGRRIDAYLQLKVTDSEVVRGKILIDSPGFDADAQRTATLKLTDTSWTCRTSCWCSSTPGTRSRARCRTR